MQRRQFLATAAALTAASLFPVLGRASTGALPKGMVTFSFDDGIVSNYNFALPLLKSRGQVATAGIVVSRMLSGNNDYMTVSQVRELAASGWEIASHSLTHSRPTQLPKTYDQEIISGWDVDENDPNHYQAQYEYERIAGLYQDDRPLKEAETLAEMKATPGTYWLDRTIAELHAHPFRNGDPAKINLRAGSYQREMEQSHKMLKELGFNVDTYVAPHNYWTNDVEAMCRAYYARACTGNDSDNRAANFDPFAIRRFMAHSKDSAQSYIRIIKDHCLEHGGWVVFCFHGTGEKLGWEPVSMDTLGGISSWLAQEGIPVVTVREGAKRMQALKSGQSVQLSKSPAKKGS